jgi:zinc/manganese transport system substrate-binding protein
MQLNRRTLMAAALSLAIAPLAASPLSGAIAAEPLNIVAAENFYGDVAQQLGGAEVKVTSILSNPDQDPHLFEASPSTARALSDAELVIYNGADYDPWVAKLLAAAKNEGRQIIVVADLMQTKSGDNPHLWYNPETMHAVAKALTAALVKADPSHAADYQQRLANFLASLQPMADKVKQLRATYAGQPVTATEPVFGYMTAAIGLEDRNQRFQLSIMNDTEPSAGDVAAFQDDLKHHKVRALIYNNQTSDDLTTRLLNLAKTANVPVVGVSETEPAGKNYQEWMLGQLNELEKALAAPVPVTQ